MKKEEGGNAELAGGASTSTLVGVLARDTKHQNLNSLEGYPQT
jgi:hypothetical protein